MGENANASSSVIQPADTSTPVQDPAAGDTSEINTGPYEVVAEVVELPERPFFTTPFEEYTVTEGLLLLLVVAFVIRWIIGMLKGGFSWL